MKPVVLVVDTPDGIRVFRETIEPQVSEMWDILFASSAKESFDILQGRAITVVVFNICLNEIDPVSYAHQICKNWPRVQVIFDGSRKSEKKCRLSRQEFLKSPAFDMVGETEEAPEVVERIQIAIQAKRMKDTGFY